MRRSRATRVGRRARTAPPPLILFSGTGVLMFIHSGRMTVRNVRAVGQQRGMDANFAVMVAVSTTKPAAMAVAARKREKIPKDSRHRPAKSRWPRPRAKKIGLRVCKAPQFVLWSHLMSAEPRSDRRIGQGEDLKKGNTQKTPRATSMTADAWHRGHRGSIATRRRSPHFSLLSLLPVTGLAGARASTLPVALTRVWRRRHSGRPGESC